MNIIEELKTTINKLYKPASLINITENNPSLKSFVNFCEKAIFQLNSIEKITVLNLPKILKSLEMARLNLEIYNIAKNEWYQREFKTNEWYQRESKTKESTYYPYLEELRKLNEICVQMGSKTNSNLLIKLSEELPF